MTEIVSRPDHSVEITEGEGKPASFFYQLFFDDLRQKLNDSLLKVVELPNFTLANLPTDVKDGSAAYATGLAASPTSAPVWYDGTNWRRFSDDTTAS